MKTKMILGSRSPRRKEILEYFSLPFEVIHSPFDEDSIPCDGDHKIYAQTLARGKAAALAETYPDRVILTADTVVSHNGNVYGKPRDDKEAFTILQELAGSYHLVITGVAVRIGNEEHYDTEETTVHFNHPSSDQLRKYHNAIHCVDKAGGYAIQMAGSLIVKDIDGCFYNVMGLPINTVDKLLSRVNLSLWDYLV